jgi:predicted lipid-binding transport protein (Tim44 family)
MWKKIVLALSLLAFTAAVTVPADVADARKSFSSGKRSYTKTPAKSQDQVSKSTSGTKTGSSSSATGANAKRGFFSGGSLMKGLMIGGLAGLFFGSVFSGMGFFGNFLGLLVNVLAIIVLIAIVQAVLASIRRKRETRQRPDDSRRW